MLLWQVAYKGFSVSRGVYLKWMRISYLQRICVFPVSLLSLIFVSSWLFIFLYKCIVYWHFVLVRERNVCLASWLLNYMVRRHLLTACEISNSITSRLLSTSRPVKFRQSTVLYAQNSTVQSCTQVPWLSFGKHIQILPILRSKTAILILSVLSLSEVRAVGQKFCFLLAFQCLRLLNIKASSIECLHAQNSRIYISLLRSKIRIWL